MKTPDFSATKCRTFKAKHRNFPSKKSDVFIFRSGYRHKKYHTDCDGTLPPQKRKNKTSQKEGRKRLRGKRKDKDSFTYGIQINNDAKRKRLFFVKMPDFLSQNNVSTIHLFAKITKFASSSTWIQAHIRNPPHL